MNNLTIIEHNLTRVNALTSRAFAENYFLLCRKEKRVYTDEEVAALPAISIAHPHYNEWMTRKHSCNKLMRHIKQNGTCLNILEIGCGFGWMAAKLAAITSGEVTGVITDTKELSQARRVFKKINNLKFLAGNIHNGVFPNNKFDVIIFSASIEYLSSLEEMINTALTHLTLQGQIHIIDSPFYKYKEIPSARLKIENYYSGIGLPEMAGYRHYHCIDELDAFQYKILYNPFSWVHKISLSKNPYPWILVKNRYQ